LIAKGVFLQLADALLPELLKLSEIVLDLIRGFGIHNAIVGTVLDIYKGLAIGVASVALLVGACGNVGGRILSGWLSDRVGRLTTLRIMVLASAVAMPLLFAFREQLVLLYILLATVYWCYGTQLSVFASTTADIYGTRNLGMNYGALFTAWGAAGILGPMIAGRVFDATRSYQYAFYAASGLALVAFASLLMAKPTASAPEPVTFSRQSPVTRHQSPVTSRQ